MSTEEAKTQGGNGTMGISIKRGCTRTVFLVGRWAIKIPTNNSWKLFLTGFLCNMQEAMYGKSTMAGFCPVKFCFPGGWFLVMYRTRPLSNKEWEEFDYEKFIYRGNYCIPVEDKRSSFGVLDGEIVAIDYGD